MRMLGCCLFVALVSVHAEGSAQKVTLVGKDLSLEQVFTAIRQQTGFVVFSNKRDLRDARPVTIAAREQLLSDFLDRLFKDQPLEYIIRDRTIVVSRKPPGHLPASDGAEEPAMTPPKAPPVVIRVVDKDGNALAGATVTNKKTKRSAITDGKGMANLVANAGDVVEVSFIGFTAGRVTIGDAATVVVVSLKPAESKLDEAQIIAYGKTSQRYNTGNVVTITEKDIEKSPVQNVLLAISGRVPGVRITQNSGLPGGGVTTIIQGRNSFSGGTPFYVVDGVPYLQDMPDNMGDQMKSSGGAPQAFGNPLNYLNPADIESVSVLKDAVATSIYGSRAANGAILITTKKGKKGTSVATASFLYGMSKPRFMKLLNTAQYVTMRKEALANDGLTAGPTDYDVNGFWDTTRYTDWQKVLFGRTAGSSTASIGISGGSGAMQYNIGGTYGRRAVTLPGNFSNYAASLHFSMGTASENTRLRTQLTGSYMSDFNRGPLSEFSTIALLMAPNAPALYNPDGTLNWAPTPEGVYTFDNPMAALLNAYEGRTRNLVSSFQVSYDLAPGLQLKTSLGYTNMDIDELRTGTMASIRPDYRPFSLRSGNYGVRRTYSWSLEPQLSYRFVRDLSSFEVLAGATLQQNASKGYGIEAVGFSTDEEIANMGAALRVYSLGTTDIRYKYAGAFVRLNYNHSNRYLLDLSARRDGSSRFGPANRYNNYYAIGAGWIFSSGPFLHKPSWLSLGKIKASFGVAGVDAIGDYAYLNRYFTAISGIPYRGINTLRSFGLNNPYLQWQDAYKTNIGADLGFFKDRLVVNANYFINWCSNQLTGYNLPITTGASSITRNFPATIQNTGWELMVNATVLQAGKFTWTANANASARRNKLVRFDNIETSSYGASYIIGKSINTSRVYRYAGVDPTTGVYGFYNSKGDIVSLPNYETDQTKLVNYDPKWEGGLSMGLTYGRVSIDFSGMYVQQVVLFRQSKGFRPGLVGFNQPSFVMDRWQKPGDKASIQRFSTGFSYENNWYLASTGSDASISPGGYFQLRNVVIGFDIPVKKLVKSLRVSATGQNLLTLTAYKGFDPENYDTGTLAPLKSYSFSLQASF